ncbi:MAG: S8 family peptidase [Oligoflexus sp.]|nr:S8 family peptidase [Pseudopedobacter sp.]
MKVANVWNMGYTGTGVKVAVIDLGVDLNHPDLQANLLTGYDATGNNSGGAPVYDAYNTHGTNCAGIIAEVQNNIGAVGIAYNAKIIPIRFGIVDPPSVNPNGYITTSDTWESNCFNFAVSNGADIISNSWGGGGSPSSQLNAAILNAATNGRGGKGAIVLFSAGNNNNAVSYPASNPNVIAVGASSMCDTRKRSSNNPSLVNPGVTPDPLGVSCDDEFWWGSNYGTNLDIMAPGVKIATTTLPSGSDYSGAYVTNFNGTSAACPNTAAVAALILSANLNLTGQQVRNILESSADKVGGYSYQSNISGQPNGTWSSDAGYGRVNACTTINAVLQSSIQISGPAQFCTSASYTIPNLPIGATVNWSVSGTLNISGSNTANPVTITKNANGAGTLTASITSSCGTFNVSKDITTPFVVYPIQHAEGTFQICANTINNDFSIQTSPGSSNYNWSLVPVPASYSIIGNGTNNISLGINNTGNYTLKVAVTTDCGMAYNDVAITVLSMAQCGGGGFGFSMNYYPNPANTTLTVQYLETAPTSQSSDASFKEKRVILLNEKGKVMKAESLNATAKKVILDIRDIPNGTYYLHVKDGKETIKEQIIIQH